jgi:hypothetical protein
MTTINKINFDKSFDEFLDRIKNDENIKKICIVGKDLSFNYDDLEFKMNKRY